MRKSTFTEEQINKALLELKTGKKAKEIAKDLGITTTTLYLWKRKNAENKSPDTNKIQELEKENKHLKSLYIELAIDNKTLRESIKKY